MNKNMKDKLSTYAIIVLVITAFLVIFIGYKLDEKRDIANEKMAIAQEKADKEKELKADEKKVKLEQEIKAVGIGKTIKYIPMGDSLTSGYFATTENDSFVNKICGLLNKNMSFTVDKGINKAITNNHYGSILAGALTDENIKAVNSQQPDLITIEYGTNDCNSVNNVSPDTFRAQLNTLIDDVTTKVNRKPIVILLTTWNQWQAGDKLDNVIIETGKQRNMPVVNLKSIYSDPDNKGPKGNQTFKGLSDDFHPNNNGMEAITNAIYEKAEPIIYERYKTGK